MATGPAPDRPRGPGEPRICPKTGGSARISPGTPAFPRPAGGGAAAAEACSGVVYLVCLCNLNGPGPSNRPPARNRPNFHRKKNRKGSLKWEFERGGQKGTGQGREKGRGRGGKKGIRQGRGKISRDKRGRGGNNYRGVGPWVGETGDNQRGETNGI
jgi:hypothetical protein